MENSEFLSLKDEILTKNDLCEILKAKLGTVTYLTTSGQLPYFKIGKECRYRRQDVLDFIEKRMKRPTFRYFDPNKSGRI